MAPLAQRYVRIAVEPGFAARFRAAGSDAGKEFARSFKLAASASLAGFNPRVRVQLDVDSFARPVLPPINLRVGFDMSQAIAAGRRAAAVANAAAGPINLNVNGGGFAGMSGLVNVAGSAIHTLSISLTEITNNMTQAASSAGSFGNSLMDLGGPIGQALGVAKVAAIISLLPAAIWTSVGAIYALGGALGSLPALSVGLGASVGALGLGFMGLGQHLKATGAAGGGAAKSMSAVNNAARSLARAQRDLLKATKEIDRARAGEIERIDDLGRALRGAYLDEGDAVSAVAKARVELAEARAGGDVNAIGEADRAYQRSLLTLDEARDKVGDLAEDKAKADKDGVEGSDAMVQAYERQRDAVEQVRAAEEALAEAQKSGGGGGAAQQLMKLAPAAQEVVDKLKALKPAFEEVRLAVQQQLFQGVAPELQRLADTWKQPLKTTLVSYAGTFNGLFKQLGESVRNPTFVKNITSAADTVRRNIAKIGTAISGPFVDAFGRLARAAQPFVDMLGDKLAGAVEHFSDWIKSADESGALTKFFQDAAYYAGLLWDIGGNVLGLLGDIFKIIFQSENQGGAKPFLESFNDKLLLLRDWLKDPENQKKIKEFVDKLGDFAKNAAEITTWITEKGLPFLTDLWTKIDEGKDWIQGVKDKIDEWIEKWQALRDKVLAPFNFAGMFDGLYSAFKWAVNRIIDGWNRLRFSIPSFDTHIPGVGVIGGASVGATYIQKLAKGGVVQPRPGGALVNVAEAGEAEIVEPRGEMRKLLVEAVRMVMGETQGGGGDIIIPVCIGTEKVDEIVVKAAERNKTKMAKAINGGNRSLSYAS